MQTFDLIVIHYTVAKLDSYTRSKLLLHVEQEYAVLVWLRSIFCEISRP